MKTRKHRISCFLLSFMLVLTLIPQISFAAEGSETPQSGVITGFEPLETDSYYFEGDPTEEEITVKLPDEMKVYLDGNSSPVSISVSWESVEDFDSTDFYFYSMKPVWDSDYTLSTELSPVMDVPWITVYKEDLDSENELMVDESELEPIYVNEEEAKAETGESDLDTDTEADTEADTDAETENDTDAETDSDSDLSSKVINMLGEDSYAASSNTDKIYAYLTNEMGLNMAAACGVMTNINAESAMNPINLENTYNTRYGLSDAEYTKRVDAGKGAYKSGSGESRNFRTDYCGYGLCQWTSLGRRSNLLDKALSKKVSVGNINMQLEFLESELKGSYESVYSTIKQVPNTAQGAYMAAYIFCNNFEIPANTKSTAASRAKTCLSSGGYWQKYSGSTASVTGSSYLTFCGYTYPTSIKTGKGISVYGYAISNYELTNVSAVIRNSSGKTVYSASKDPNTTVYSLYGLDDKILFSKLSAGNYTYTVSAKDKKGKVVSQTHKFTVASDSSSKSARGVCYKDNGDSEADPEVPASTLALSSYSFPEKVYYEKSYTVKGTVKSNYNISNVDVTIRDADGNTVQSSGAEPAATSYSLTDTASDIDLSKLAKGTYTYTVKAKDELKTSTLKKTSFKVESVPYIKISDFTYPESIKKGKSYPVRGIVKSNYNLKLVRIKITTKSGTTKLKVDKTLTTAKSYNLKNLDSKVKFGKLAKGTYYYKVYAKSSRMSKTLIYEKFTVK